ncbi:amidohydrolase family protein [archaeon]|nr:amidohydrolase family protein [archaeon]
MLQLRPGRTALPNRPGHYLGQSKTLLQKRQERGKEMIIEGNILIRQGITYGQVEIKNQKIIRVGAVKQKPDIILKEKQALSPLLYDSHVHLRDLEQTSRETIKTGTAHLASTGVIECSAMPNTKPPLDNHQTLKQYLKLINSDAEIKVNVYGLLTPNSYIEELERMQEYCNKKYKAFQAESIGSGFFTNNEKLKDRILLLPENAEIRIHCEDPDTLKKHKHKWKQSKPRTHIKARPAKAEAKGIRYITEKIMPLRPDLKYFICHVSSWKGLRVIKKAKKRYDNLYCEAAYHHLYFSKKDYKDKGVKMKCNPSIKKKQNKRMLIRGLKNGLIDCLVSDHAPHTLEDKIKNNFSGLPSYDAGVFGWLVKKCRKQSHYQHLLKAATKPEYEIREGNKAAMMILNLEGKLVKAEDQETKAGKISPYNNEVLPYIETIIK